MRFRRLGRSDLNVSTVALGSWLTYGGSVGETAAIECIARAHDLGVTFFDTANVYSGGRAEEILGRALAAYPRDSFVVGTKVFFPVSSRPGDRGLSRRHILDQIDKSLHRLQLDHVDLYQCHRYDDHTPLEETCAVMDDLVRAGKIRHWGVSEWTPEQIERCVELCRANAWPAPVSNQPQYSALLRQIEPAVIPTSERLGLSQVVWSPLAQGVLTGKYRSRREVPPETRAAGPQARWMGGLMQQPVLDAVQRLRPIAESLGISMAQLALAWCLRLDNIAAVIVGATRPEHVDDNVGANAIDLDPSVIEAIEAVLDPVRQPA